ncbi:MAG TPA: hypothetical protein VJH92_00635 [Candidatus Nanoarchaeia archaeon]|nr:hypothetical protein [Candidatus Nanoarchaeia archaeon]
MIFQVITIGLTYLLLTTLIYFILAHFNKKSFLIYFIVPLTLFVLGFILRLSLQNEFVDLGYFLTEISNLWLYILFTLGIILGQVRYWKK